MKRIAIIGAGDLGQQIAHYISHSDAYKVVGFFDDFGVVGELRNGVPILGNITKNKMFILIISFVVIMQVILIYKGGELFRTSGLTIKEFLIMMLFSFTVIPIDFIRKIILKIKDIKLGV